MLGGIFFGSSRGSFSKEKLSKMDLPFRFCEIGLRNTLFVFGRLFWLTLKNWNTHRAEKDAFKEKTIRSTSWELLNPGPKVLIFCRFTGFTKMQLFILDGRSVLDKPFFQNEVQRVLYKLVLVTYPLDHSRRIYSPLNFRFIKKLTRICASLGLRMKFKTLCYPVFERNKNTALPSFWFPIILIAFNASIIL